MLLLARPLVALRKLVEQARRESVEKDSKRAANERAYNFMSAMAGNLQGFEEAIRALFAGDREKFEMRIENWPEDIRQHACWLAFGRLRVRNWCRTGFSRRSPAAERRPHHHR